MLRVARILEGTGGKVAVISFVNTMIIIDCRENRLQ
jgi:hypothetical protein